MTDDSRRDERPDGLGQRGRPAGSESAGPKSAGPRADSLSDPREPASFDPGDTAPSDADPSDANPADAGDGGAGDAGGAVGKRSPRGADIAREALDAARARNAAARGAAGRGRWRRSTGAAAGAETGGAQRLRRRRWSGPGADKARDPQLFGDVARTWVAKADTGGDLIKARLFEGWSDIVGPDIAAHAQPTSLVDKELVVQAESTAWATQLRLLAPGMVQKINQALGHGTVLRIRAKGPTAPSWRFGNRHIPGRGPRDTYG